MTCLPLLQTAPRPTNGASAAPVTVREDNPWLGTGKMLGNLFVERNWLIPKDYLAIDDKKEDTAVAKPPPVEQSKMGEQTSSQKEEKCGWGPDCLFCKAQKKEADLPHQQEDQQQKPLPKPQAKRPNTLSLTKTRQQWEEERESVVECHVTIKTKYNDTIQFIAIPMQSLISPLYFHYFLTSYHRMTHSCSKCKLSTSNQNVTNVICSTDIISVYIYKWEASSHQPVPGSWILCMVRWLRAPH